MITIANAIATGTNDDGTPFSYPWNSGAPYQCAVTTAATQVNAATSNAALAELYREQLQAAQADIEKGNPATAPVKPQMKIVHDQWNKDGTPQVTYGPFVPPLPDLIPATAAGPSMIDTITAARAAAPPDPATVAANGVGVLIDMVQALQASVAKLLAKGA